MALDDRAGEKACDQPYNNKPNPVHVWTKTAKTRKVRQYFLSVVIQRMIGPGKTRVSQVVPRLMIGKSPFLLAFKQPAAV